MVCAQILNILQMNSSHYRQTEYVLSAHSLSQMPTDTGAEVAFVGRSNVGKSSVINALTGRRGLAKTSKTPGRTQGINFFSVADNARLVDLPGYGFARAPVEMRAHWGRLICSYLETRQSLCGLVLISDIRRVWHDADEQMLDWCDAAGLSVRVLLSKSDKLSFGAARQVLLRTQRRFSEAGRPVQLFSALKKKGVEELCQALDHWLFPRLSRPK